MSRPTTRALARELLMYTNALPAASDSADGIGRWWLDAHAPVDPQALREALDFLVARGAFAERLAEDGRRRYRRIGSGALLRQLLTELTVGVGQP